MSGATRRMPRHPVAIVIALCYALAGILWIVFSDRVLAALVVGAAESVLLQTAKGVGFVLLSALALYAALTARVPGVAPAVAPPPGAGWMDGLSIRTSLLGLIGIPLLAFVVALGYDLHDDLASRTAEANRTMLRLAERSAEQAEVFFADTERSLDELAKRPRVRAMDATDCDPLLKDLRRLQPAYANVLTLDARGQLVCSAVPPPPGAPAGPDPRFVFDEVVRTKTFSVGKPARGFVSGRWVSALAHPVIGTDGTLLGVVAATVDLASYQPLVTRRSLPAGVVVAIMNGDRTLIARSEDAARRVGSVVDTDATRRIIAQREGTVRAHGYPDTERFYGFAPIGRSDWIAVAGLDAAIALAPVRDAAVRRFGVALLATLGVLALTLAAARRLQDTVAGLVAALARARDGDDEVRAALTGPRELADIARQLNAMIEARARAAAALRASEARVRRLSGFYAVLSHANRALLRLREPQALYQEICRICVEYGHASIAHVALAEDGRAVPVAWAGPAREYLAGIDLSLDPARPEGHGMAARAIRDGRPCIVNDCAADPAMEPWRARAAPLGTRASAAFPVRRGQQVIGALSLHVTAKDHFDPEVVALLEELAGDLSFALDSLDREAARAKAERDAAAFAARFEKVFLGAPEAMSISELESGRLVLVNEAFCRTFERTREELVGRSSLELGPWADAAARDAIVAALRAGQVVQGMDGQTRARSGELRHVLYSAEAIEFGGERCLLLMFSDVTERRRAEAQLHAEEARLRTVAEHSPVGIYMANAKGERIYRNRALQSITGLNLQDVQNEGWLGIVHDDDRERVRAAWRAFVARDHAEYDVEHCIVTRSRGERQVRVRAVPIHDGTRLIGFTGTLEDITDRKRMEQDLRAANRRLRALSMRLLDVQEQERAAIARELHDEIGQTLTAAKLQSQALVRELDAASAAKAARGVAMLDQVLARTRDLALAMRPPQLDHLGLVATLRDALNRIADAAGVEASLAADPERIELERGLAIAVFRVAQEALTNAVRHASPRRIAVELRARGDELLLAVSDDGRGYELEAARERAIRGGSMGLFGMEERVALAGGRLLIVTRPGQGTRVQAIFPLATAAER